MVTLSTEPGNWLLLGPCAMAGLCALLHRTTASQAALRGWWFGCGLFGSGASWVFVPMHVYGAIPAPVALVLAALFCAFMAVLFTILPAWLFNLCYRQQQQAPLIALGFASLWAMGEGTRSWILSGFPWLMLGTSQAPDGPLAGWGPIVGVYGISFLIALTGAAAYLSLTTHRHYRLPLLYALLAWLIAPVLKQISWTHPAGPPISVDLVQPDIPQGIKWQPDQRRRILDHYLEMSRQSWGKDWVVWPETALPFTRQEAATLLDELARQANRQGSTLVSGIVDQIDQGRYHNSIMVLGESPGLYHKRRLVPFGEYVPFESWVRKIGGFFDLPMSSFIPGPSKQPLLQIGGIPTAAFVCYEVVYPGLVAKDSREAELLLTVSNDTWFGRSIAPAQHLQMAQMRALETGKWLIRGTNNGISAIVDHRGQVIRRAPVFQPWLLSGPAGGRLLLGAGAPCH